MNRKYQIVIIARFSLSTFVYYNILTVGLIHYAKLKRSAHPTYSTL
jgi:hypothetical protein